MKSYQIHFIRHGITAANENGQYIGSTDLSLSERGKNELSKLSKQYKYPGAGLFYTSPLKRCVETFRILYPEVEPVMLEGFSECDFGSWEGKTAEDLENDTEFQNWLADANHYAPPGGESGGQFTYRVCSAFETLVQNMMKKGITSAVIVTHGDVITTLLSTYGIPKAHPFDWMTEHGCGYSLRIIPNLWMRDMVAEVYAKVPLDFEKEKTDEYRNLIDMVREAADRAYGNGGVDAKK